MEGVELRWLRSTRGEDRGTLDVLVKHEVHGFSRERQVLDGGPASDKTNLSRAEVRVAACDSSLVERRNSCAEVRPSHIVVPHPSRTAEQARRPVRIPVVVERTTNTKGFRQMERTITREGGGTKASPRCEDTIRGRTDANSIAGSELTVGAAHHKERRRGSRGRDDVLGVTLGPACVDLDVVARTGRDVLDLQRSHHRTAQFRRRGDPTRRNWWHQEC